MDTPRDIQWPALRTGYTDEFGRVEPEVYEAAGAMWRAWGERFARAQIGDAHLGLELALRAAASVSKIYRPRPGGIQSLAAYLATSYRRLVLKEARARAAHFSELGEAAGNSPGEDLDRKILLQEIIGHMDDWTRETFELRALGNTFDEIAEMRGENAHRLRTKFGKRLDKLRRLLEGETKRGGPESAGGAGDDAS